MIIWPLKKKDFKAIEIKMKRAGGGVSSEQGQRVDDSENKTRGLRRMQMCKERSGRNPVGDSVAKNEEFPIQPPSPVIVTAGVDIRLSSLSILSF